jgi:hypothetical protein
VQTEIPMSMRWLERFLESLQLLWPGDLWAWDLLKREDPLQRVLHLRFSRPLKQPDLPILREFLKGWCTANDCVYRKSDLVGTYDFKALIVLKGLGPERNNTPFDELLPKATPIQVGTDESGSSGNA